MTKECSEILRHVIENEGGNFMIIEAYLVDGIPTHAVAVPSLVKLIPMLVKQIPYFKDVPSFDGLRMKHYEQNRFADVIF